MENEEILLKSNYIVLAVPETTIELRLEAKIYLDGELKTVKQRLGMRDVKAAVEEAEMYYAPPDAEYVLTERGKAYAEYLDSLKKDSQGEPVQQRPKTGST